MMRLKSLKIALKNKKDVFKPFGKRTSFYMFSKLKLLTRMLASFKCK